MLAALPLLLGLAVAGCGDRPVTQTTIIKATDAVVVSASGATSPARSGQVLKVGEALRTRAAGAAILGTRGRQSYLGSDSLYYVKSAAGVELRRGALIVDSRSGPPVSVEVDTIQVGAGRGSIVRLERSAAVRVGVLAGSATLRADGGAALEIPRYRQALVVGQTLPSRATALTLRDDPAERAVAPDLVADDESLQRTAAALDAGPEGLAIITAATQSGWVAQTSFAPAAGLATAVAAPSSELALPVAIARAAVGIDARAVERAVRQARALRSERGSWGVVARIVGTNAIAVSGVIDALLGPISGVGPPSGPGTTPTGPVINLPGGGPSASPSPRPSPTRSDTPSPTPSPRPSSTPSPSTSPDPLQDVKDVVGRLIPSSSPSPPLLGHLLP